MKEKEKLIQRVRIWVFSERGSDFSLRSREIRSSDFFGPRRKVGLCSKDYAW